jgi:hypothetical protein
MCCARCPRSPALQLYQWSERRRKPASFSRPAPRSLVRSGQCALVVAKMRSHRRPSLANSYDAAPPVLSRTASQHCFSFTLTIPSVCGGAKHCSSSSATRQQGTEQSPNDTRAPPPTAKKPDPRMRTRVPPATGPCGGSQRKTSGTVTSAQSTASSTRLSDVSSAPLGRGRPPRWLSNATAW